MSEFPLSPVVLRQKREHTIARLCEHFAQDRLEAHELEELIDRAHQAQSLAELDALLVGLPAASAAAAPAVGQTPLPRPAGERRDQALVMAVMGGAERTGHWAPPRELNVVAVMGGVDLDFRTAQLDPGITEVRIFALMGGVEILVPPGVQVDSSGIGIMGGFEDAGHGRFPVDLSRPVLRVTGVAIMGGVEITERLPGESGKQARLRRRREGKALREEAERKRLS